MTAATKTSKSMSAAMVGVSRFGLGSALRILAWPSLIPTR
jgi:hypothetical protein